MAASTAHPHPSMGARTRFERLSRVTTSPFPPIHFVHRDSDALPPAPSTRVAQHGSLPWPPCPFSELNRAVRHGRRRPLCCLGSSSHQIPPFLRGIPRPRGNPRPSIAQRSASIAQRVRWIGHRMRIMRQPEADIVTIPYGSANIIQPFARTEFLGCDILGAR